MIEIDNLKDISLTPQHGARLALALRDKGIGIITPHWRTLNDDGSINEIGDGVLNLLLKIPQRSW